MQGWLVFHEALDLILQLADAAFALTNVLGEAVLELKKRRFRRRVLCEELSQLSLWAYRCHAKGDRASVRGREAVARGAGIEAPPPIGTPVTQAPQHCCLSAPKNSARS